MVKGTVSAPTPSAVGYDKVPFDVGSYVELSPHLDLWMQGATHGIVRSIDAAGIKVRSTHPQVRKLIQAPADCFRAR